MKIERDKWYLRRDGEKMRVICTDAPGNCQVIAVGEHGSAFFYSSDGAHWLGISSCDLVSEDREPQRLWVNFYEPKDARAHFSEAEARFSASYAGKAARISVEFVEVLK